MSRSTPWGQAGEGAAGADQGLRAAAGCPPMRSRLQASVARGLTRFVGREGELDQLRQALGRASSGHGQVVAVVEEAGVGKARLVWEVNHSPRAHGWLVLQAGSVSYGKATLYLPVIDLLKGYFAIDDRDGPRAVREKLTGKLATLDRGAGRQSAGAPVAARRADRGPAVADARSAAASPAHPGGGEAALAAREPGAAAAGRLRGPPLDRLRDPGTARWAGREPAGRPDPAPCELPAGVSAPLGQSHVLHAAPAGPLAAGCSPTSSSARSSGPTPAWMRSRAC